MNCRAPRVNRIFELKLTVTAVLLILMAIIVFFPRSEEKLPSIETIQEKTEQTIIEKDYTYHRSPINPKYLLIKIRPHYDGPPENPLIKALTDLEKKYEFNQPIPLNEKTFLIEIFEDKSPAQSSPHP